MILQPLATGFSKNAKDLGGENFPLMKAPKVLLLSGNGVTSTEFGAAWYYFDEILNYPVTIVDQDKLRNVKPLNSTLWFWQTEDIISLKMI